ncbi:hypothetical protein ACFL3C_03970 [Patescibacteria group bacterium]
MNQDEARLPLKEIYFSSKFPFTEGQKNIFKEVIEWQTQPPLVKTGRSSFLLIKEETLPFKGIKIKGCGYFDIEKNIASQPSDEEGYDAHIQRAPDGVKEIHYQIEVDDKDELVYSVPEKRPYGAQLSKKAKLEYEVNKYLFEKWEGSTKDFPFYFPLGYAEYQDLAYNNEPLGATLLGMQGDAEIPLGQYFEGKLEDEGIRINPHLLTYWQNHTSVVGSNNPDFFDLISTLKKLCFEFGRSLSDLHDHFVDFDSHLFNATVNLENGRVILYDLDHVYGKNKVSDQAYFYYALKDFEVALVAILSNFMLSGLIEGADLFSKIDQPLNDFNIVEGFYEGYFHKLSDAAKEHAKSTWERLITYASNQLLNSPLEKRFNMVYDFCEKEREESFINAMPYLSKKYSFEIDKEKHKKIISAFIDQRKSLEKAKEK